MAADEIRALRRELDALKCELAMMNQQNMGFSGQISKCPAVKPGGVDTTCGCTPGPRVPKNELELENELTEMTAEIEIMHKKMLAMAAERTELEEKKQLLRCAQRTLPCGTSMPRPPCGARPQPTAMVCPPRPPPCPPSRMVDCPPAAVCGPEPPCKPPINVCPAFLGAARPEGEPKGAKPKGKGKKGKGKKGKGKKK